MIDKKQSSQVIASTATLMPIFQAILELGCHQIIGNASGPTLSNGDHDERSPEIPGKRWFPPGSGGGRMPSRNSPQCLHLMASSWISSAQ